jgi:hypothetical protein
MFAARTGKLTSLSLPVQAAKSCDLGRRAFVAASSEARNA